MLLSIQHMDGYFPEIHIFCTPVFICILQQGSLCPRESLEVFEQYAQHQQEYLLHCPTLMYGHP